MIRWNDGCYTNVYTGDPRSLHKALLRTTTLDTRCILGIKNTFTAQQSIEPDNSYHIKSHITYWVSRGYWCNSRPEQFHSVVLLLLVVDGYIRRTFLDPTTFSSSLGNKPAHVVLQRYEGFADCFWPRYSWFGLIVMRNERNKSINIHRAGRRAICSSAHWSL